MRRVLLLPAGLLLAVAATLAPPFLAHAVDPASVQRPPVRLAFAPASWPDPTITWRKAIPGSECLTSMFGIGVEHMQIVERIRSGWPFPALEGTSRNEYSYDTATARSTTLDFAQDHLLAFVVGSPSKPSVIRFPTRILPDGVLGNLLVFTSPWLILTAWTRARTLSRRRRGLCTACGYPIHDATCPECGAPTPKAPTAPLSVTTPASPPTPGPRPAPSSPRPG